MAGVAVSEKALLEAAREHFGIKRFRPGQRELLEAVMAGRDALGLMPTGAGKSLVYQLPSLFLDKPVLVVSPLIALMQDQQEKAAEADIAVGKLDSTVHAADAREVREEIAAGTAQLLYVTPERLEKREFLDELMAGGGVGLFVVDEAHCIAQWGHDFRPAYLGLGDARKALGDPPVLALTATSTEDVTREIEQVLRMKKPAVVNTGSERENLFLRVEPTVNLDAKQARVAAMLERAEGTGIIYASSVRTANELHTWLTEHGVSAEKYHGRMGVRDRESAQVKFMGGECKVMVATKAFGLGVDKPDIRFVYHFEFPDSLESYAQEAGRAGRDGERAEAVLLYRLEDKRIQTFFLGGRYPKPDEVRVVLEGVGREGATTAQAIAAGSNVGEKRAKVILHLLAEAKLVRRGRAGYVRLYDETPSDAELDHLLAEYVARGERDHARLDEMMHYAETAGCRTQVLRAYFGEAEGEPCGRCDNCERGISLPASAEETDAGAEKPAVTEVETATGVVHTTAPETLPTRDDDALKAGDRVKHRRFGTGVVRDVHGANALVRFEKVGEKRMAVSFLKRV